MSYKPFLDKKTANLILEKQIERAFKEKDEKRLRSLIRPYSKEEHAEFLKQQEES